MSGPASNLKFAVMYIIYYYIFIILFDDALMSSAQSGPKDVLDLSPVSHQFQAIPQGIAPEKEPGAAPRHLKYLGVFRGVVELYVCITGGMFHTHTYIQYIYIHII